jgi:hypothetical protein
VGEIILIKNKTAGTIFSAPAANENGFGVHPQGFPSPSVKSN